MLEFTAKVEKTLSMDNQKEGSFSFVEDTSKLQSIINVAKVYILYFYLYNIYYCNTLLNYNLYINLNRVFYMAEILNFKFSNIIWLLNISNYFK